MADNELVIPQSSLDEITRLAHKLQAGIFRSTSKFKLQPRMRQLVIEPVLKEDYEVLFKKANELFPSDRITVEKVWRKIVIDFENVTFTTKKD